jgi:hypothetical protein
MGPEYPACTRSSPRLTLNVPPGAEMVLVTDKERTGSGGASAYGWLAPGELRLFEQSGRDKARASLAETSSS